VGSSPTTPIEIEKNMMYLLRCRLYRRPFFRPLVTGHGSWTVREGIILQLRDEFDRSYWSEIAPLPQFGSETLAAAWEFCNALPSRLTAVPSVPDELPATQFAFSALMPYGADADIVLPNTLGSPHPSPLPSREREPETSFMDSAPLLPTWEKGLGDEGFPLLPLEILSRSKLPQQSFLLPAGSAALTAWQNPWQMGYRTFKWKIGVGEIDEELELLGQLLDGQASPLVNGFPPETQLRLDANGSLSFPAACRWLEACADRPQIEFIEQPVADLEGMMELADRYPIPLAIDELVSNLSKLKDCYKRGWRGIYVIKPAIAGDLQKLSDFIQSHQLDVVVSSSLETAIGQNIIQRWATAQGFQQRIPGMAVAQWFPPDYQWFADLLEDMRQPQP
jgi:o-succinylbenzoate synthase